MWTASEIRIARSTGKALSGRRSISTNRPRVGSSAPLGAAASVSALARRRDPEGAWANAAAAGEGAAGGGGRNQERPRTDRGIPFAPPEAGGASPGRGRPASLSRPRKERAAGLGAPRRDPGSDVGIGRKSSDGRFRNEWTGAGSGGPVRAGRAEGVGGTEGGERTDGSEGPAGRGPLPSRRMECEARSSSALSPSFSSRPHRSTNFLPACSTRPQAARPIRPSIRDRDTTVP